MISNSFLGSNNPGAHLHRHNLELGETQSSFYANMYSFGFMEPCHILPQDSLIGKEGPRMVMTDNCDELRHVLELLERVLPEAFSVGFMIVITTYQLIGINALSLLVVFARKLWLI